MMPPTYSRPRNDLPMNPFDALIGASPCGIGVAAGLANLRQFTG